MRRFFGDEKDLCMDEKVFLDGCEASLMDEKVFWMNEKVFCMDEKIFWMEE